MGFLFAPLAFIASHLLASTPTTTITNPTTQVVGLAKDLYRNLSTDGPISLRYSPTVTFSFVPPPINNTKTSSSSSDSPLPEVWSPPPTIIPENHTQTDESTLFQIIGSTYGSQKPIAIYLPGADGVGISATSQFDDLARSFELWRLIIDTSDRSSFSALTDYVSNFVETIGTDRDVILIGESFGGLLAPSAAIRLQNRQKPLKGLVLVNPATSYDKTQWDAVAPLLTSLRHLEDEDRLRGDTWGRIKLPSLYSVVGGLALASTIPDMTQLRWVVNNVILDTKVQSTRDLETVLLSAAEGFGILAKNLPAETLEHRVSKWLLVGTKVVNPRLSKLNTTTIVIAGADDNMLPTKEEAERLSKVMPNCTKVELAGKGHWVLDDRVNLTKILLDSPINPMGEERRTKDPITEWKKPTKEQFEKAVETRVKPFRRLVSPAFFSTKTNGERRMGLSHVPGEGDGPILFVANHQFGGLDLGLIVAELIEKRNIYARGLAHPVIFQAGEGNAFAGGGQMPGEDRNDDLFQNEGTFQTFGAVMVTPRNYYRLMETNQTALLFPGGVREVFHGKNEAYQLFWPEKVDFVRIAAKFNATIVPLSAIGAADSVNILIDAPDILKLPFGLGERAANSSRNTMAARFDSDDDSELFTPPLAFPKPLPARHYFMFGKPMKTNELNYRDRAKCDEFYEEVKNEMQRGFDDLLKAREKDPYKNNARRIAYELVVGKSPPSFGLDELQ